MNASGRHWIKRHSLLLSLLALMLVAFALRVYRLDFISLRGDEAFTVVFVQRTWEGLWKGIRLIEPNPPLLYLALRGWIAIAGDSEFVTRFFAAFFGVLCVPLVYRLAREFLARVNGRRTALMAALLMAINPFQIWHAQDVRNYTMWPALSLGALVFFWLWWQEQDQTDGRNSRWLAYLAGFTLLTIASLYTHYYDAFILVALNVFVFAITVLRRQWALRDKAATLARWSAAQAVLALIYLPWVLFGTNRVTTYGEASAEQSVPLLTQFSRTLSALMLGETVPDEYRTLLWVPLALGLVAVLIYLARRNLERAAFLFLYIAVPTLALYIISIGRPLFLERYLNGIAPAYYIAFALGLAALYQWRISIRGLLIPMAFAIGLGVFLVTSGYALSNYYFDPAYAKAPDWRSLGRFIAERQRPGDMIVQNFNEMAAVYYLGAALPVVTIPRDFWPLPQDESNLEQLNRDYERIWFIPAPRDAWDPKQFSERYLDRHDNRLIDTTFSTLRLSLYATPRQFASSIRPLNAQVGKATLVGYQIDGLDNAGVQIRSGSTLQVRLYWRPSARIDQSLNVFVHLAGAGEQVVAQQDSVPVNGTWPTPDWLPGELIVDTYQLPVQAAPGVYSLVAGMYDPATLARVPVVDAQGVRQPNDRVSIVQVTVTP